MKKLPIAVQLYSIRDAMEQDFWGTLRQVKDMGYAGVEFAGYYGQKAADIRKELDRLGLVALSAHVAIDAWKKDLLGTLAFHRELGMKFLAIPYLDEASRPGTPGWPATVTLIRTVAEACAKAGIQLLYHNHDFEFVRIDGEYALDRLYREIPMPLLATEIDTCWVRVAGVDPAEYLRRYAGRAPLVHLKDFFASAAAGSAPKYALIDKDGKDQGAIDKSDFDLRPLGMGVQDMPAILAAAADAGSEWLIVEQDRSTGRSSLEAIGISRRYLANLGY